MVGIDEVGRGPLAGPVAVGAVAFLAPISRDDFPEARDSKKLSARARERIAAQVDAYAARGALSYTLQYASARAIDQRGIVPSIKEALTHSLAALSLDPALTEVRLDGTLKAPSEFLHQTSIIRGDETELSISLASIVAKVARDRLMEEEGRRYPQYGFEKHKGYGTVFHYQAIREHGLCPLHRVSFVDLTKIK